MVAILPRGDELTWLNVKKSTVHLDGFFFSIWSLDLGKNLQILFKKLV